MTGKDWVKWKALAVPEGAALVLGAGARVHFGPRELGESFVVLITQLVLGVLALDSSICSRARFSCSGDGRIGAILALEGMSTRRDRTESQDRVSD